MSACWEQRAFCRHLIWKSEATTTTNLCTWCVCVLMCAAGAEAPQVLARKFRFLALSETHTNGLPNKARISTAATTIIIYHVQLVLLFFYFYTPVHLLHIPEVLMLLVLFFLFSDCIHGFAKDQFSPAASRLNVCWSLLLHAPSA